MKGEFLKDFAQYEQDSLIERYLYHVGLGVAEEAAERLVRGHALDHVQEGVLHQADGGYLGVEVLSLVALES